MARSQRRGRKDSATRDLLLDAAQALMVESGFAAVTSRRIAERVGLTHQSVFYYFGSLDELFIALIHRNSESFRSRLREAFVTQSPLEALWTVAGDRESVAIELEVKALSVHNEKVRAAMAENLLAFRRMAVEHLAERLPQRWADQPGVPLALVALLEAVGRHLALDEALAISEGHGETRAAIEMAIAWLQRD